MKTQELLTIEFRYTDVKDEEKYHATKTITIGVFDTLDEAIIEGNKALEIFEKHFKLNTANNKKERFSKNGGCFGTANRLVSPLGYLQTPFDFYAKIKKLTYGDIEQNITEILEANERYKQTKNKQ